MIDYTLNERYLLERSGVAVHGVHVCITAEHHSEHYGTMDM